MNAIRPQQTLTALTPDRAKALEKIPCPAVQALIKTYPGLQINEQGEINTASFVKALESCGFSYGLRTILGFGLKRGAQANGKSGEWFNGADMRKTFIFDGFATFISREGFNPARFEALAAMAKNGRIGNDDLARFIRACAAEQSPKTFDLFKTIAEHSMFKMALAGNGSISVDEARAAFGPGVLTPHFLDASEPKSLPRVLWNTTKTLSAYLVQSGYSALTGHDKSPTLPPIGAGASAAFTPGPKPAVCPFGHG